MEDFQMKRLFKIILNKKYFLILFLVISMVVGYIYSYNFVVPLYKSTATILLTDNNLSDEQGKTITQSDLSLNQKLVSNYIQIIKSDKVVNEVINNLNLNISKEELNKNIEIKTVDNTEVLKIAVINEKADLSAEITNELIKVFSEEALDIYKMNNVNVIDEAKIEGAPYNINHLKDIIIFGFIGIFLYAALVFFIYVFDTTISLEEEVEEFIGLNVLTSMPLNNKKTNSKQSELITEEDPKSPISEFFRTLRSNIMFTQNDKVIKSILITSANQAEGKSWISSNLAVTFAKSNKKVVIVDIDMRKGRQNNIFKVMNRPGLSNCLATVNENITIGNIAEYIRETKIPNLHIITGGDRPPNPSELLTSTKMFNLINLLKKLYDIVILDGTPSAVVADSIGLTKIIDTNIIVISSKKTKLEELQKVKKAILNAGGKIAGVVINKVKVSSKTYQSKYYYSDGNKKINSKNPIKETRIQTVEEILQEFNELSKNNLQTQLTTSETPGTVDNIAMEFNNTNFNTQGLENKLENLNAEINTIKTLFAQNIVNTQMQVKENTNNQVEILNLRGKIEDLKQVFEELFLNKEDTSFKKYSNELKNEINSIKEVYEKLIVEENKKTETLNEQLQAMQKEYINILDDKISSISNLQDINEVKFAIKDLKNNITSEFALNNNKDMLVTLKEKMDNMEERYNANLDTKFNNLQNIIKDNTNREYIEELITKVDNLKIKYGEILEDKFTNMNDKIEKKQQEILENINISDLTMNIDVLKSLYENDFKAKITNIEDTIENIADNKEIKDKFEELQILIKNSNQTTNILELKGNIEELKANYEETLQEKIEELQIIMKDNNQTTNILELKGNIDDLRANYQELLQEKTEEIQTLIKNNNQTTDILELKGNIDDLRANYQELLQENITKLQKSIDNSNPTDNLLEVKRDIRELKVNYQDVLEDKVKKFQYLMENNNQDKKLLNLKEELIDFQKVINNELLELKELIRYNGKQDEIRKLKDDLKTNTYMDEYKNVIKEELNSIKKNIKNLNFVINNELENKNVKNDDVKIVEINDFKNKEKTQREKNIKEKKNAKKINQIFRKKPQESQTDDEDDDNNDNTISLIQILK